VELLVPKDKPAPARANAAPFGFEADLTTHRWAMMNLAIRDDLRPALQADDVAAYGNGPTAR
jgi:hypothetical protein